MWTTKSNIWIELGKRKEQGEHVQRWGPVFLHPQPIFLSSVYFLTLLTLSLFDPPNRSPSMSPVRALLPSLYFPLVWAGSPRFLHGPLSPFSFISLCLDRASPFRGIAQMHFQCSFLFHLKPTCKSRDLQPSFLSPFLSSSLAWSQKNPKVSLLHLLILPALCHYSLFPSSPFTPSSSPSSSRQLREIEGLRGFEFRL